MWVMIKLQTPVADEPAKVRISYKDKILLLGSCFSDNMGAALVNYGFEAMVNPFGTIYNPASVCAAVHRLASGEEFTGAECVPMGSGAGKICSFSHHTSFARESAEAFLSVANNALRCAHEFFKDCNKVIITLGTAWCFRYVGSADSRACGIDPQNEGKIVSNCLKRPAKEFVRERLGVEECVRLFGDIVTVCNSFGREKELIFTVSPIRHLADGAHGNQLSKSTLLLSIDKMMSNKVSELTPQETLQPQNCEPAPTEQALNAGKTNLDYFPAYEIMMDELRDYRFYAEDMLHPSPQAIAHITERFLSRTLTDSDRSLLDERIRAFKLSQHQTLL